MNRKEISVSSRKKEERQRINENRQVFQPTDFKCADSGRECHLRSEKMSNCEGHPETRQGKHLGHGDGNRVWLTQFASIFSTPFKNYYFFGDKRIFFFQIFLNLY